MKSLASLSIFSEEFHFDGKEMPMAEVVFETNEKKKFTICVRDNATNDILLEMDFQKKQIPALIAFLNVISPKNDPTRQTA